ncbi:MAG: FadR family transcriptional regulator [Paenibacillaceae bacterium]|nr:FadR family transcriptional regulator [Paenibacillaceae bacterium]
MLSNVLLSDIVTERIKAYIVANRLAPGDRLPNEKELVEKFAVSRTVVRESLKALHMVDVVRIKSGDGLFVGEPSLKSVASHVFYQWKHDASKMRELLDTRIALEQGAVEMAIRHNDARLIEEMEQWNRRLQAQEVDPDEGDLGFHRALFAATGNGVYAQLSDILTDFFHAPAARGRIAEPVWKDACGEHAEIVAAIRRKNVKVAKQMMALHLETLRAAIPESAELSDAADRGYRS